MESFIKDEGFFFYTKGRFDAMHAMPKTGKQPDRLF
jgi:hypothetical protein